MSKYLIENLFGIDGWNIARYGVIIAMGHGFRCNAGNLPSQKTRYQGRFDI